MEDIKEPWCAFTIINDGTERAVVGGFFDHEETAYENAVTFRLSASKVSGSTSDVAAVAGASSWKEAFLAMGNVCPDACLEIASHVARSPITLGPASDFAAFKLTTTQGSRPPKRNAPKKAKSKRKRAKRK